MTNTWKVLLSIKTGYSHIVTVPDHCWNECMAHKLSTTERSQIITSPFLNGLFLGSASQSV